MTSIPSRFMRASRLPLALALLVAGACGGDGLATMFGQGCNAGLLRPGEAVYGSFTPESCVDPYHFYSENAVPYEAYTVQLVAGRAYMFHMAQISDPVTGLDAVDPMLALWGRNSDGATIPLAFADDNAGGTDSHDSEIFFVAPSSGIYQLVAYSYDDDDLGGYRVTANECPVLAALDTAGTYNFALRSSRCYRHDAGGASDPVPYVFFSLRAEPDEDIALTVTTTAFTPTGELFGPGFDTNANLYSETASTTLYGSGNPATLYMYDVGGRVTIGLGGTQRQTSGAFTLILGRTPAPTPPPRVAEAERTLTLKPRPLRKER
jgi:hypothetical protein